MYADEVLQPWLDVMLDEYPEVRLAEVPPHAGRDGSPERRGLTAALARVTPHRRPTEILARALAEGARGIRLDPAADCFRLDDPALDGVYDAADERHLAVLVRGGPELPGVAEAALDVCDRFPGLRLILSHCSLNDLRWLAPHVEQTPNLFFDTSWAGPAHVMALMRAVPPSRILSAADLPSCTPVSGAITTLRCAQQAGLSAREISLVAGEQAERLLTGKEPSRIGAIPAREARPLSPTLEMLAATLLTAMEPMRGGECDAGVLTVARHACQVADDDPEAEVVHSVMRLLDLYEEHGDRFRAQRFTPGWDILGTAAVVARTPAAPVPS